MFRWRKNRKFSHFEKLKNCGENSESSMIKCIYFRSLNYNISWHCKARNFEKLRLAEIQSFRKENAILERCSCSIYKIAIWKSSNSEYTTSGYFPRWEWLLWFTKNAENVGDCRHYKKPNCSSILWQYCWLSVYFIIKKFFLHIVAERQCGNIPKTMDLWMTIALLQQRVMT